MKTIQTPTGAPASAGLAASRHGFDFIGDIHGNLPALKCLGRELGYDIDDGWRHPEGRLPVFLGDLIDRGPYSLETALLVADLVRERRAFCIMGNHEYNLVAWEADLPGWQHPKRSNAATCADVRKRPADWAPALAFFQQLPIALEFDDLRVIHASWHLPSIRTLPTEARGLASDDAFEHVAAAVTVGSPFAGRGMRPGLSASGRGEPDTPHETLLKGHELPSSPPFSDADGHLRSEVRVCWWNLDDGFVPKDRPIIVGHYWNLPPVTPPGGGEPAWAPPEPSGHPALREWWRTTAGSIPPNGRVPWTSQHVCVDFNGFGRMMEGKACVGAARWPEREVVWATAPLEF